MYQDAMGVWRHGPPCGTWPPGPPVDLIPIRDAARRAMPTPPVVVTPVEVIAGMLRDVGIPDRDAARIARRMADAGLVAEHPEGAGRPWPWWGVP